MKRRVFMKSRIASFAMAVGLGLPAMVVAVGAGTEAAGAAGGGRQISASGTGQLLGGPVGSGAVEFPEIAGGESEAEPESGAGPVVDRSSSENPGRGNSVNSSASSKSNPELKLSFDGLNHRNQRLANGGNQFSLEPPDQGLCVGNGFVMETVNDVIRVFNTAGTALTDPIAQNSFYGYAPAINRTTGVRGPFVTDPSCLYDNDTQRWYHVVLTLDTQPNGAFTGGNHLDLAVSNSSSPL